MIRRLVLSSAAAIAVALVAAAPVSAHIHADPAQAQAGSTQTIGFTIEHGCDGSPTVGVDLLVPDGASDVTPEPFDGWTASLGTNDDGEDVVSYTDGTLPDGEAATFEVTLTLPPTPDTTVYFPIVQRCEEGELRWIEVPVNGEEPDYPAPGVELVGPVVTTTAPDTVAPGTSAPDTATPDTATPDTATPETSAPAAQTTAPTGSTATDTVPPTAPATSTSTDADDDSNTGTVAFIMSAIAVLIVAAIAYTVARRNRQGQNDAPADDAG